MPLSKSDSTPLRVGFVGCGMMGGSMIDGLIGSGTCVASDVFASDIVPARLAELTAKRPGLRVSASNADAADSDVIVIAVEPKDCEAVCAELVAASKANESAIYVSLAAGVTIASLAKWLGAGARIVRVMPNTPCTVGEMAAGYMVNAGCSAAECACVGSLLGALGSALRVHDEEDLDAVTGVSGSGPAYVFQFIEALSDGGVRMGLHRAVATELAAKTVRGAATMVLQSGKHPGALKDEVTSPGGTTIAAVHALEQGGMRAAVINAVVAATEKSRALGKRARED